MKKMNGLVGGPVWCEVWPGPSGLSGCVCHRRNLR